MSEQNSVVQDQPQTMQEQSMHNFLYLHPNENPATTLVSPVLDPTNYHSWSRSIITALSVKNKVEFIYGSVPQPVKTYTSYSSWNRCNNMVVSWIVHSVSVPIRQSIIWMDVAADIWKDLKTRFGQGDLLRILDLQLEAYSLCQGELTVTEYFTKLRVLWDELENFRPDPICSCPTRCSCKISSIIVQWEQNAQTMRFIIINFTI